MALFNNPSLRKPGFKIALTAFCLAVVVVTLGAFTRLVDAGLGCPDWPGCYGHLLWPVEGETVARANEAWPDAPVDHAKTWPEMVHRYAAGLLMLLIVGLAFLGWKHRENTEYPFRLPMLILFLVVWQALFGMWTVTLKLWPQIVAAHLIGGMAILSLLWVLTNRLDDTRWRLRQDLEPGVRGLKPWVVAAIVVVTAQILLGGWTTANYAAYACPDFPTCHGDWVPEMDLARGFDIFQTIGPNYLGGILESDARVAIHYVHRLGAIATALVLLALAVRLLLFRDRRLTGMALIVTAALVLQVGLGIANVVFHIPLSLAVAHNAGAALLLLTLVTLGCRVWMAQPAENRG